MSAAVRACEAVAAYRARVIVGESPALLCALETASQFAPSSIPIVIVGETGTGKDLFARHIHERSGRGGAFVDVNCGALPRELVEGILFGRKRGAYTGAVDSAEGLVEAAHHGTLFLDELSSLPLESQGKFLRVLESGEVRRVGETGKRRVDFRLVAAAQPDLTEKLSSRSFRHDLFQRMAGVVLELPPLADRGRDASLLAGHFATAHGLTLDRGAAGVVGDHDWPGNVRELKATVDRAALLCSGPNLTAEALVRAIDLGPGRLAVDLDDADRQESLFKRRAELRATCDAHDWDAARIAAALGVGRTTLFKRLRAVGLSLRGVADRS